MSEMILQQLLTEAGSGGTDQELTSVDARGVEVAADWGSLRSPENYLGYERTDNFVSPNGSILETSYAYAAPTRLRRNHWALSGDWTVKRQAIVLNQAGGRLLYRFSARDLHLVMAPTTPGGPIRFRVRIDGQPRHRRRRPGQRHPHRTAAVPAHPPARPGQRAHLRGHLPGSWCPGLRLHLRLRPQGVER